ncbi:MAG: hypothetical protein OXC69_04950 [Candidatus Tectomicrobia bacterium]|nr:hypothetical protein [Candidatus Tectomicrobia bacterium]
MSNLREEMAAYETMRSNLEIEHFGKWVIIHNGELEGVYDDFQSAADNAVRKFGRGPYIIEQVVAPPEALPASVMYGTVNAKG